MGEPKYKGPTGATPEVQTEETEDLKRKINNLMQDKKRFKKALKIIQDMLNEETNKQLYILLAFKQMSAKARKSW